MAVIIIFGTVLSFSFYLEGTKIIGESKAGILSSVEPVVSTIISTVWLNVKFDTIDFIGFAIIIFTACLIVKDKA